jgi:uncharacterized protein YndB with AHSA1/START domain
MAENKITATQKFDASAEKVFAAWTEFEQLKQWWKPLGKTMIKMDQSEGSNDVAYHFSDGDSSDGDMMVKSKYEKIEENKHLVYSWNWYLNDAPVKDGLYKLDVEFRDTDGGSEISVTQSNESEEEGVHPHSQGWDDALKELKDFVENH